MNFLSDQDVYAATIGHLRSLGHDVLRATDLGLAQADDAELLRVAAEQHRILVTRDRDFGALVFLQGARTGVVYLRILPATQKAVHDELTRALSLYDEQALQTAFMVIEPGRHRMRRLISKSGS